MNMNLVAFNVFVICVITCVFAYIGYWTYIRLNYKRSMFCCLAFTDRFFPTIYSSFMYINNGGKYVAITAHEHSVLMVNGEDEKGMYYVITDMGYGIYRDGSWVLTDVFHPMTERIRDIVEQDKKRESC